MATNLNRLEKKLAQLPVYQEGEGTAYHEIAAACLLDYYRRYGGMETLNRPEIVARLADRKSTVVDYSVVAKMLLGLLRDKPNPESLLYSNILIGYSHVVASGPEQARNFLFQYRMWVQL